LLQQLAQPLRFVFRLLTRLFGTEPHKAFLPIDLDSIYLKEFYGISSS
jgi:hypothetical protein